MKSKIIILLILCIFGMQGLFAEEYIFEVSKIELKQKGNLINALNGKIISSNNDLEIDGERFTYIKNEKFLEAFNGTAYLKKENIKIKFNILKIKNNNILQASDGVKIDDLKNSLKIDAKTIVLDRTTNIIKANEGVKIDDKKNSLKIDAKTIVLDRTTNIIKASDGIKIDDIKNNLRINSDIIVLDRLNNIVTSPSKSLLTDKNNNLFQSRKFEYKFKKKKIRIFNALISDSQDNNFEIDTASIDLKSNTLEGKNILINLNNSFLNPDNEPRLKGEKIIYSENTTQITKGIFTACKETDKCPPWELSAEEITHDRIKKNISYKNVWLNIYDVPVVYFPKFFHPDPTVKRQSGFLMPTFKNSPNKNTFFSIPYYKVLSDSRDLTFTPRFYAKDQILVQNEYREIKKNSKFTSDFSFLKDKKGLESHLFIKTNKNLDLKNFNNSYIDFKVEQVSNDTYLKANKLTSPLISSFDVLENSFKLYMNSDTTSIDTEFIIFESLNKKSSDKYEYILPKIQLVKDIKNNTNLSGSFKLKSDNFIQNYNTNVYEKVNTNNLIYESVPKIHNNGFNNNIEFIIKNSNTNSKKSIVNKEGSDYYLSGLFQFNSKYPLVKRDEKHRNLLTPKISLKVSPAHSKDLSNSNYRLDVDNLFNLDRISSTDTLEGGVSLAYGIDYLLSDKVTNLDILSLKLANNLRLHKNDDLEKNNQLNQKTSNFFGQIRYNPFDFINATYDFSTLNNASDMNYQNLISEIKFNKFIGTLDYLKQDGDKNSYFLNKATYNIDESNNISFSTRENLKTDLTEYYNLVYEYKNDCLAASIEYQKDFYSDRDIKPAESIFLKLTIIPFGTTSSPNIKQ